MRSAVVSLASVAVACVAVVLTATAASAQNRLPIPEGAWIEMNETCGTATDVWVYFNGRVGDFYYYGPNMSMGPDSGSEPITSVEPSTDGFTGINDSGLEVRPVDNNRIYKRVLSRAYGEMGRRQYQRCSLASLPARMRNVIVSSGMGGFPDPSEARQTADVGPRDRPPPVAVPTSRGWSTGRDGSNIATARARQGVGAISDVALTCQGGRVMMAVQAQTTIGRAPTLRIAADGRSAQAQLTLDPRSGVYVAIPAPPPVVMLMAGGADQVEVAIDGRSIGNLPLGGAPTAIAEALAPCWRGADLAAGAARQTAGATQYTETPPPPEPPAPPDFPVTEGFYALRDTCAQIAGSDDHDGYIYLTRQVWRDIDGDSPITGVVHLGGNRWRIDTQHGSEIDMRVSAPGDFTVHYRTGDGFGPSREETLRYRHCPLNTVPARVRREAERPIDYTPYHGNG